MAATQYLYGVVSQQSTGLLAPYVALTHFNPLISQWAAGHLLETKISGSNAKGTAVKICADVDIFISLSPTLNMSLGDIYDNLFNFFSSGTNYRPRRQNVSIRVNLGSDTIDLVPAKRQSHYTNDHSLYVRKKQSWMQTNIDIHISTVVLANKADVIKLTKIWRERHQLEFPSLHLELAVIRALAGHYITDFATQFAQVLTWLADNITTARFVDPANTNNVISDDLTASEKQAIAQRARLLHTATNWNQVVW